jgi:hypothetical protein
VKPSARHAMPRQRRTWRMPDCSTLVSKAKCRMPSRRRPVRRVPLVNISNDMPAWQLIAREAQTPAFGGVLMVGVMLSWLGVAIPFPANHMPDSPAHVSGHPHPASVTPPAGVSVKSGNGSVAPVNADVSDETFRKLESILSAIDRDPELNSQETLTTTLIRTEALPLFGESPAPPPEPVSHLSPATAQPLPGTAPGSPPDTVEPEPVTAPTVSASVAQQQPPTHMPAGPAPGPAG